MLPISVILAPNVLIYEDKLLARLLYGPSSL